MGFSGFQDPRFVLGTHPGTLQNITSKNYRYGTQYGLSALSADPRIDHKVAHRFGMRREESAPCDVVPPTAGRLSATAVEADPPLHVCFGHPHGLFTTDLREDDQVRQARIVRP